MRSPRPRNKGHKHARSRRRAVVKTWQPKGRLARTIKTRWLTLKTPARFIKDAAALVPQWRPRRVTLAFFDGSCGEPSCAELVLEFGRDKHGESTSISVKLEQRDVSLFLAYLLANDMITSVLAFGALRLETEGDGGEELLVPTISTSALANMQTHAGVH